MLNRRSRTFLVDTRHDNGSRAVTVRVKAKTVAEAKAKVRASSRGHCTIVGVREE